MVENFKILADEGITLDLKLRPSQLERAAKIIQDVPNLRVIINPCGSPIHVDLSYFEELRKLAEFPNVFMKMPFDSIESNWPLNTEIRSQILEIIAIFTSSRCMFASNFTAKAKEGFSSLEKP